VLDQLKDMYTGVAVHATADDEHAAALELLLLVMMSDGTLRLDEQAEIAAFSADHEWDSATFNYQNALGPAYSRVRTAMQSPDTVANLIDDIDARIASRVLRSELVSAARDVADADGTRTVSEDRIVAKVIHRFG
jgi:uncharacterized tellurite resistance protein B-like protein